MRDLQNSALDSKLPRDLSIRGAGNLLGKQQHGFIDSVGFDLYSQLLSEAVLKKQGEKWEVGRKQLKSTLQIDAYIPASYIQDERQKSRCINAFARLIAWKLMRNCSMTLLTASGTSR